MRHVHSRFYILGAISNTKMVVIETSPYAQNYNSASGSLTRYLVKK